MRALLFGLVAIAISGCFDPDSPSGSGTDSSADTSGTGGGCQPGGSGCPCYGNATCDAGLECNATVELCIPADCTPGSDACTCNDGACLTGLECEAGVCVMPSATTDPATTDPATSDPTTDPSTTDPSTTDPSTTDPATTDPSDSSATDPTTTDPATTDPTGVDCEGDCSSCLNCAIADGGACGDPSLQCGADPNCVSLFDCCNVDPDGCATCCADAEQEVALPLFMALTACVNDGAPCPGCAIPSCG